MGWEALITVSVLVLLIALSVAGFGTPRGQSQYTGVVSDVEIDKGLLFKTSQARVKTSAESSTFEDFCIPDAYEQRLRDLARSQEKVTIAYSRPMFVPKWRCQGGLSIIQDVEEVGGN